MPNHFRAASRIARYRPVERASLSILIALTVVLALPVSAIAQSTQTSRSSDGDIAQQLSNPLASLISLPLQSNFDFDRQSNSVRYNVNFQPVVPIKLTDNLNLISRTIIPFDAIQGSGNLGNVVQSFFFSPQETAGGLTVGAGPVIQLPTRTSPILGTREFAIGPTGVIVQKAGPFLFGVLANHLWSVGEAQMPPDRMSATFVQPFASYTWPTKTTLIVNTESSYDWVKQRWTVPINVFVNQLVTIGGQRVQFGIGPRYFAERPDGGARWGVRFNLALVFPDN